MDAPQGNNTDVSLQAACPGCIERDRRIAELQSRVKQLETIVERLRRSGKRRAAPFSRGLPKLDPQRPGRKSGEDYGTKAFRVVPPVIDEEYDAPLPGRCPRCGGGPFIDVDVAHQYQVEIPRRPI